MLAKLLHFPMRHHIAECTCSVCYSVCLFVLSNQHMKHGEYTTIYLYLIQYQNTDGSILAQFCSLPTPSPSTRVQKTMEMCMGICKLQSHYSHTVSMYPCQCAQHWTERRIKVVQSSRKGHYQAPRNKQNKRLREGRG